MPPEGCWSRREGTFIDEDFSVAQTCRRASFVALSQNGAKQSLAGLLPAPWGFMDLPFISWIKRRRRARQCRAATAVLLALYVFRRLDAADQARVDADVKRLVEAKVDALVLIARLGGEMRLAALRGPAMARLGIATGVPGLDWAQVIEPSSMTSAWPFPDFMRNSDVADDALEILARHGARFDKAEGIGNAWLSEMKARYP